MAFHFYEFITTEGNHMKVIPNEWVRVRYP